MENLSLGEMMQWLYVSQPSTRIDFETVQAILTVGKRNNSRDHVNGILVYDHKHFIQYVEGPPHTIANLKQKIESDDRHHHLQTIHYALSNTPHFSSWNLSYVSPDIYIKLDESYILNGFNPYEHSAEELIAVLKKLNECT